MRIVVLGAGTVGGSIANVEAVWAARNLRFQSVALARAVREDPDLEPAKNVTVKTADGRRARLAEFNTRGSRPIRIRSHR